MSRKHFLIIVTWLMVGLILQERVGSPGDPLFQAEDIHIQLEHESVHLVGNYLYENPRAMPILAALYTPLPDPTPTDVSLTRRTPGGACRIPFLRAGANLYWILRFEPHEEIAVDLAYRQPLRDGKGRYILETTWEWRRAIPRARFTFHLSGSTLEPHFSLDLDKVGSRTWSKEYTDFWPARDLGFELRAPGVAGG